MNSSTFFRKSGGISDRTSVSWSLRSPCTEYFTRQRINWFLTLAIKATFTSF